MKELVLRIHYGPGYRVYFKPVSTTSSLVLWGGDKDSQDRDIVKAKRLAKEYQE